MTDQPMRERTPDEIVADIEAMKPRKRKVTIYQSWPRMILERERKRAALPSPAPEPPPQVNRIRREFLDELMASGAVQTAMSYDEVKAALDRFEARMLNSRSAAQPAPDPEAVRLLRTLVDSWDGQYIASMRGEAFDRDSRRLAETLDEARSFLHARSAPEEASEGRSE